MTNLLAAGLFAAALHLPFWPGHARGHEDAPLSTGERHAIERRRRDNTDYPDKYAGRTFTTIGTAYRLKDVSTPLGFQETRTNGAAVSCSSVIGPMVFGEQVKVAGVLQSPVFTWDDVGKTFYLKDCNLSR